MASFDPDVNKEVENELGKNNNSIIKQLRKDGAFCDAKVKRPTQFAHDGMLLFSRVNIINDPLGFLQDCVSPENVDAYNEANKTGNSESALNTSDAKLKNLPKFDNLSDANKATLQTAILAVHLPNTTNTYKTVVNLLNEITPSDKNDNDSNNSGSGSLKVYESKPNLASVMKDHHLRTLCSVSGTTTDIVAALWGMNEEKTKAALQSLRDAVAVTNENNNNNNSTNSLPTVDPAKLSPEFKNLFLSIALYMQSGQYHSAASVLCGLYCAAMSLVGTAAQTVVNIASYSALLRSFATNPGGFFPPAVAA
ncbi:MAG: hypothetical protein LBI81_03270 [Puniceicoccales bacterium]|nr:hypothetical protein [Puniceicoccales bacterium]